MNYPEIKIKNYFRIYINFCLILLNFCSSFAIAYDIFIDDELKEANLNPKVIRRVPIEDGLSNKVSPRSPDPIIDLEFGLLTQRQFDILNKFYLNRSAVQYNSNRTYYLTDFLTPQMQALLGKDFHSERTSTKVPSYHSYIFDNEIVSNDKIPKETILSVAQCWGTFWNNINILQNKSDSIQPFNILLLDQDKVKDYLLSDKYSANLSNQDTHKYGDLIALVGTKPNGERIPVHFSLYAGFGLTFEKQDGSNHEPFRTISFKDSFQGFSKIIAKNPYLQGAEISIERRRFLNIENIEPLPLISRVSPLFDAKSYQRYGRTAARTSAIVEQASLGDGLKPELSLNTPIRFQINPLTERGEIRPPYQKYFTEAYILNGSCKQLFN